MLRGHRAALTWAHARRGGFLAAAPELPGYCYRLVLPWPQARGRAGSNGQFSSDWSDSQ